MSSATWAPATNASSTTWDENQTLSDLQRNATAYDDANTDYDSIIVYYDGYDPATTTPEGAIGALWSPIAE
jgi:hypothetical protein